MGYPRLSNDISNIYQISNDNYYSETWKCCIYIFVFIFSSLQHCFCLLEKEQLNPLKENFLAIFSILFSIFIFNSSLSVDIHHHHSHSHIKSRIFAMYRMPDVGAPCLIPARRFTRSENTFGIGNVIHELRYFLASFGIGGMSIG